MPLFRAVGTTVAVAMVISSAACSVSRSGIDDEGTEAIPHSSLQDWATYADHLLTVDATAVTRSPLDADEQQRGQGIAERVVSLQVVDNLWTRSGSTRRLPATIQLVNGGWAVNGDQSREVDVGKMAKVEAGPRYLAVVAFSDVTAVVDPQTRKVATGQGAAWIVLDLVELTPTGVVSAPNGDPTAHPALTNIGNLTPAAAAAAVAATQPDPAAGDYMTLDPFVRAQFVGIDRAAADPMTPGPGEK